MCVITTEDPLVPAIAKQMVEDREQHDKTAREWTKKYAIDIN